GGGIYKSTDGGGSWLLKNNGIADTDTFSVNDIAIDPQNPSILYISTASFTAQSHTVYKSTDGGEIWTPANTGLPGGLAFIGGLIVNPQSPSTVYAGATNTTDQVFRSTNGGATWQPFNTGFPATVFNVRAFAISPNGVCLHAAVQNNIHGVFDYATAND